MSAQYEYYYYCMNISSIYLENGVLHGLPANVEERRG